MTELEPEHVARCKRLLGERLGLRLEGGVLDRLDEVLRERLRQLRIREMSSYLDLLTAPEGAQGELRALAEHLTVGETYFFRNAEQFRALVEVALPERIRAPSSGRPLRILSAGCATGEEPYSLAIFIRQAFPELRDVQILGVDLTPSHIERARQARYSLWSLRETSTELRGCHFRFDGKDYVLSAAIREMVAFEQRNLFDEDPGFWYPGAFDIVFCRNVVIYFSAEAFRALVGRIARSLVPGGYLFLGHSETLRGISEEFHLRHTHETFYYQRRGANESLWPTAVAAWPTPPAPAAKAEPLQAVLGLDNSWADAIGRASKRIAALVESPASAPLPAPSPLEDAGAEPASVASPAASLGTGLQMEGRNDPDAQLLRAVELANRGAVREAEEACKRVLSLDEFNAGAHYVLALCCEHSGDNAGALDHDRIALYLDPDFVLPHLHLGLLSKRAGQLEAARREFGQALEQLPREDASRILLFGGGMSREELSRLCARLLRACGGTP